MKLEARALSCGYDGKAVVSGVDFRLEAGAITVILGPNGSGKSTIMKTLLGLLKPVLGSVAIDEANILGLSSSELARALAYVPPEERPEFPFLVREVVLMGRLPLSRTYFDSETDRAVAAHALATVDCSHLAERPIGQVSAGERQRVLIGRALAQESPILLMDEPTSHLDPAHQVGFARIVRSLAREGKSIMIAVHDLNLAKVVADQAILISNGKVVANGLAKDVLREERAKEAFGVDFELVSGRLFPVYSHA